MAPGDSFSKFVVMQNAGTIGISRVGLTVTQTAGSTYLFDKLRFRSYGVNWPGGWPIFMRTGPAQVDMLLKDVSDYQIWTTLAPLGMSTGVEDIEIYFPSDADSTYQGLSTTWTFSFLGTQ